LKSKCGSGPASLTSPSLEPLPFLNLAHQHNIISEAVNDAFTKVYTRNRFILGAEVEAFEAEYADYCGVPQCVGVGNGLDALTLSLMASGIGAGHEVIVPAHTYLATWLSVTRCGAVPVPVDADPATCNLDVTKIPSRISTKTRAILPVHLYGQPCNMTKIDEHSRQFNLPVIEDNAQAHGAMWRESKTGTFGIINATSFYPTKNLGALGDGGAVTTFDSKKAEFVRRNRNYGLIDKSHLSDQGVNSRLDEIQAAFLRIKLRYLDIWNEERRRLAAYYLERLKDVGDLILPLADKECVHVYHLFVIQSRLRDILQSHLMKEGIETLIHYPVPPHLQHAFRGLNYRKGDFPQAERIAATALSLPLWPGMKNEQLERVVMAIRKCFSTI
jgi:dTDP-4-amino-4,6-dideoxygalactose transaminase